MPTPVSFALLGAGGIARAWARAFAQVPLARLVGVWEPNAEQAEALAAEFHCALYASEEALLEDEQVEAVIVCSPNLHHAAQTVAAAEAGKHVLTEKPMALTVGDCDRMIAACEQAGVLLMVGQALRFCSPFAAVLERARAGDFGRLLAAHIIRMGIPARIDRPRTWRNDESQTGGWLLELNVHEVDYLQALLGLPERVCAYRSNLIRPPTPLGYDLLNVLLACPEGRQGHLMAGEIAQGAGLLHYAVFGEEATVRWYDWGNRLHICRPGCREPEVVELPPLPAPQVAQLEGFRAAIRGEGPVPVTGQEGRDAVATCTKIREAWERAEAVASRGPQVANGEALST